MTRTMIAVQSISALLIFLCIAALIYLYFTLPSALLIAFLPEEAVGAWFVMAFTGLGLQMWYEVLDHRHCRRQLTAQFG